MKTQTEELAVSENRYKILLESLNGIVWEADRKSMVFDFVSKNAISILGYTPEEWMGTENFCLNHVYPDDMEMVKSFYYFGGDTDTYDLEFRMMHKDGSVVWLRNTTSVLKGNDGRERLSGIMMDITLNKLLADLEQLEKQVLEMNAEPNAELDRILHFHTSGIERLFPAMKCSVLRISNGKAYNWASPSLPEGYVKAINELTIGQNRGSCGTAAFLNKRVIATDIEHDERWADFKDLAMGYGLRACWSQPIVNSKGAVVATFAMYYTTVKTPNEMELSIIDRSASLMQVIIENKRYAATISEMNLMASQAQELANFGTWQWDMASERLLWSDELYRIYGLDSNTFVPSYENYLSKIHDEDRERVRAAMGKAIEEKKEIAFEERIVRPSGEVRCLQSWLRVMKDDKGNMVKLVGACLDVTRAKESSRKMQEIAWQQSHVVRAPLARILGLVQLLQDGVQRNEVEDFDLYNSIVQSANELDVIIRKISETTYDTPESQSLS
ncbi:MAG: PAS domain-containing protein [Flavipsychrobacter sp.]|nr:PAS domain-containing protein [Flavipsychrobacter sp.]